MTGPLSNELLELVVHVANGHKTEEIAVLVHRSPSNVRQMLVTARKQTGAKNLPHLVSIVIASGVLEWSADDSSRSIVANEH